MKIIIYWIALVCACDLAPGQTSSTIYVSFRFQAASATDNITPTQIRTNLERNISERLVAHCTNAFPYWNFASGTSTQFSTLKIWLTEAVNDPDNPWLINMQLSVPGLKPRAAWQGTLFGPTDYRRLARTLNTNTWE